ncbi:hypothetical protein GCM10010505_69960 [Kitasatospora aburaviensis]
MSADGKPPTPRRTSTDRRRTPVNDNDRVIPLFPRQRTTNGEDKPQQPQEAPKQD